MAKKSGWKPSKRALEVLRHIDSVGGTITPRALARFMWPDHPCHRAMSDAGHGVQRGKKAWLMAGSYACRLIKRGVLSDGWNDTLNPGSYYKITHAGRTAIGKE